MSLWHKEVVRLNGSLKAYIEIQDDWTGNTRGDLRKIHETESGEHYAIAEGEHISVDDEIQRLINYENKVQAALQWYRETKF